jgi:hypothetical protein
MALGNAKHRALKLGKSQYLRAEKMENDGHISPSRQGTEHPFQRTCEHLSHQATFASRSGTV